MRTKEEQKAYNSAYYAKNRAKILANRKTDDVRVYQKKYYLEHRDEILLRSKVYARTHKSNSNKRLRNRYHSNASYRTARKQNNKRQHVKRRLANRRFIDGIKLHYGCLNPSCGWKNPYIGCMLDFHHVSGEKGFSLASTNRSRRSLIAEMNKCTVLCANCHRMVTYQQLDAALFSKCRLDETGKALSWDTYHYVSPIQP